MPILLLNSELSYPCCFSSTSPADFISLGFVPCPFLASVLGVCHCLEKKIHKARDETEKSSLEFLPST